MHFGCLPPLPKWTCFEPELHCCCWVFKSDIIIGKVLLHMYHCMSIYFNAFVFMPLPNRFMPLGVLAKHEGMNFCYTLLCSVVHNLKHVHNHIKLYCKLSVIKHSCLSYMGKRSYIRLQGDRFKWLNVYVMPGLFRGFLFNILASNSFPDLGFC